MKTKNKLTPVPFNKTSLQGNELSYVNQAISQSHISGDGVFTKKCNELLESELGIKKSLLTTSCTHALEITAMLLDIKPGDEVLVPSFTFVSTVNAFVIRGARPIFIDIRQDTLNIDETKIEKLITDKTRAIIPVHYAGVACDMDEIKRISLNYNIPIIEDNAHGLFGKYKNKFLGSFGSFSTQSFHETKNFSCGEGGSLLINDENYIERAEIIREKGTDRSKFFRGQIDKYSWVDFGSSYLPSDILAAFLFGQLEVKDKIQSEREQIWNHYNKELNEWAIDQNIRLPIIPEYCEQAYHMFYLIMPSLNCRTNFIEFLKKRNIHAVFHYIPLHLSKMGKKFGYKEKDLPFSEEMSERLVRLPFFSGIDLESVIKEIIKFKS